MASVELGGWFGGYVDEARHAGLPAVARNSEVGERVGGSNSVVESQPSKLLVAGSIPVSRSSLRSLSELQLASQRGLSAEARSAKAEWQASGGARDRNAADLSAVARLAMRSVQGARRPM